MKRIIILTTAVLFALSSCTTKDSPEPSVEGKSYSIFIPQSFTPNKDNLNDGFAVSTFNIQELKCTIFFNSQIIFTTNSKDFIWDGTYEGNDMPAGNYQYRITYTVNNTLEKGVIENSVFLLR